MASQVPHRRHSPAVYRRRRLVVVIALLAVVALIWVLIAQPWRGAADEGGPAPAPETAATPGSEFATELPVPDTKSPSPSASPSSSSKATPKPTTKATPKPTPSGTPVAQPCEADDLQVEPVTDQETYGADQKPKLSMTLANLGEVDCTLNVGTSTQVFTIMSGSDTWWRSTDCQSKPADQVVLLKAGQSVSSAVPLVWDRTRSSVKTCDDSRPKAPGGGASYHLSVEIGGISSDDSRQFLLY